MAAEAQGCLAVYKDKQNEKNKKAGGGCNLHNMCKVERFLWYFREHGVKRLSAGCTAQ